MSSANRPSFVRLTKTGSLADGKLLLDLTMNQIVEMRKSLDSLDNKHAHHHLVGDVHTQYEDLFAVLRKLQLEAKATNFLNFSKKKKIKRDTQELCEAGSKLLEVAQSTSDDLRRAVVAFNIGKLEQVKGEIPANEQVTGICLHLDGPIDEETASLIAETASFFTANDNLDDDDIPSGNGDDHTPASSVTHSSPSSTEQNSAPVPAPAQPTNAGVIIPPSVPNLAATNAIHSSASSSAQNNPSESSAVGPVIPGNGNAHLPHIVVNGNTFSLPNIPPMSSPSSPSSLPYLVYLAISPQTVFNGPQNTYYNNVQNTNTQGSTLNTGSGDGHSGAVHNNLPSPNPPS